MSTYPFTQSQSHRVTSTVALEPIYNVLLSMSLLTSDTLNVEKETWLAETAAQLTPAQQHTNRLLFVGLGATLLPDADDDDFPTYLAGLESSPPDRLRDRFIQRLIRSPQMGEPESEPQPPPTINALPPDRQQFLNRVATANPAQAMDQSLFSEAHRLLNDPSAMQRLIVEHLQSLWEIAFAAEWAKKLSVMHFITQEMNVKRRPPESARAVMRGFMQRAVPDSISDQLAGIRHLIFVPSPYIQFQMARFDSPDTLRVFMLADFWTWPLRNEPIKRSEILGPARALADDVRLQILELLAAYEALNAQEIIAQLEVSQPTVSRHLKQLRNARFIIEERADGANKRYRLNRDRLAELTHTLSQLLSAENARLVIGDGRLKQPLALRPFLDRNGLVTTWPAKQKAQEAVLAYLSTKFVNGETYTEAQVNALLNQWHTYGDPAYLRRELVDRGYLKRTNDGGRYWRTTHPPSE